MVSKLQVYALGALHAKLSFSFLKQVEVVVRFLGKEFSQILVRGSMVPLLRLD
eukprot:c14885_g1_i2 orf=160-318(-)